jgi:hypothetical protein
MTTKYNQKMQKTLLFLTLLFANLYSYSQVNREFTMYHKNGKIYRQSVIKSGICGTIFRESTYDTEGNMIRQEDWKNNTRCGMTFVYVKNIKVKEIEFNDGLMESYIAYKNGAIYNQISKDRSKFVRMGKPIKVNWKKYYQPIGKDKFIVMDKNQLVNFLRNYLIPEEILIGIEQISKDFDGKKVPGDNAYLNCTSTSASINDGDINPASSSPSEKKKIDDKGKEMHNTCASAVGRDLTGGLNGASGDAARQGRVERARQGIDKMIENCGEMGGTTSGGLVSNLPGGGGDLDKLPTVPKPRVPGRRIINGDPETTQIMPMVKPGDKTEEDEIYDKPTVILEKVLGAATVVAAAGTIIAGIAALIASAPVAAPVAAGIAGVIIVFGPDPAPAPAPGSGPDASIPDDMGTTDNCERLKNFKKWCDLSNWQDPKCANAVNLFGGCGSDLKEMYVTSGGDIGSMECPSPLSAEEIARKKCEQKGMIGQPAPGGTLCKSAGSMSGLVLPNPNANVTDPPRGDFRQIFSGTNYKFADNSASLSNLLKSGKQTTMVVFMDPDCPSCQSHSNTLNTMDVQKAAESNNIQVVIVDGGVSNDVLIENKILVYPTTIVMKNGTKTVAAAGSMTTSETVRFINDFK